MARIDQSKFQWHVLKDLPTVEDATIEGIDVSGGNVFAFDEGVEKDRPGSLPSRWLGGFQLAAVRG